MTSTTAVLTNTMNTMLRVDEPCDDRGDDALTTEEVQNVQYMMTRKNATHTVLKDTTTDLRWIGVTQRARHKCIKKVQNVSTMTMFPRQTQYVVQLIGRHGVAQLFGRIVSRSVTRPIGKLIARVNSTANDARQVQLLRYGHSGSTH